MSARCPTRRAPRRSRKVLYPSDETASGQELRLRQEYFFVSASLQDLLSRHIRIYGDLYSLPDRAAIQLNDTHPAIAIAELMRILLDEHGLPWDEAWRITAPTFSYTNHTLLPEALETWPLPLFERLLPRHLQIIYFHQQSASGSGRRRRSAASRSSSPRSRSSTSATGGGVRMGQLAFVGSHADQRRVGAAHRSDAADDVPRSQPRSSRTASTNKTNGITFRRWLHQANPGLTNMLREVLRRRGSRQSGRHPRLAEHADDAELQQALRRGQARQQGRARPADPATGSASGSIRRRCSTCRSSACTNTSGSCSTCWRRSRSTTRSAAIRRRTGCRA